MAAQADTGISDGDGEIIVTAQRRDERAVDVPISITTLGATDLRDAQVDDIADLPKLAPSLRIDYRLNYVQPSIRGVGSIVSIPGAGNNVAIYLDGFYMQNAVGTDFRLPNIRSIQVLKGPQGTLFGRNSTGGAILVSTAPPSTEPSMDVQASIGTRDAQRAQAYLTTGLSDKIALDFGAYYARGDGSWKNVVTGSKDDGRYENWVVRVGLKADLGDSVSILARYSHSYNNDQSAALNSVYSFPGGAPLVRATPARFPGSVFTTEPLAHSSLDDQFAKTVVDVYQLSVPIDLGFGTLTSYSQYRKVKVRNWTDLDFSSLSLFSANTSSEEAVFTQELLLTSNPGSRLQWTTGLFYYHNKVTYYPAGRAGGGALLQIQNAEFKPSTFAAFADLTYELVDGIFLTGGLRYSHDDVKDAFNIPGPLSGGGARVDYPNIKDDRITPRIVIRYAPDDNTSVYASYSGGYKAAIPNIGAPANVPISAETMNAFEVGFKHSDRVFSLDVAAFYYKYKNLQLSSSTANNVLLLRNASDVTSKGVEAQLSVNVNRNLQLTAGGAYVRAKYDNFANSAIWYQCLTPGAGGSAVLPPSTAAASGITCPAGVAAGGFFQRAFDASGLQVIRTPKFTGNVGVKYTVYDVARGNVKLSANLYHASTNYYDLADQFPAQGYENLSLRAEWTDASDRYRVAIWGDNVLDQKYMTRLNALGFGIGRAWGEAATFGIDLGAKF